MTEQEQLKEIEVRLAARIAENQELGLHQDAIRDQRTEIRREIDALIVQKHRLHALISVQGVVAPGATVEASGAAH